MSHAITDTAPADAATWRDFADRLTPEQWAKLVRLESQGEHDDEAVLLLRYARDYAFHNAVAARIDVPVPVGVVKVDDWEPGRDGQPCRFLWSAVRRIDGHDATVSGAAEQYFDGTIEDAAAHIDHGALEGPLNASQLRQLAVAVLEVADELDGWVSWAATR